MARPRPVDGRTANDVVLDHVRTRLQHGAFTGNIILHVKDGIVRKTEVRDFIPTDALLTDGTVGE